MDNQGISSKSYVEIPLKKERESNLELLRIITMLLIIAHHYVVNSGLMDLINANPLSKSSIFLLLFGAWGKIGINCFVLITGYFMCKSHITIKKFIKLLFEIEFYMIIIYSIFFISGYEVFSVKTLVKAILPFYSVSTNFTGCYLLFYLFIPFLNILIKNMNKKMHIRIIILSLFIYTIIGTLPKFSVTMNYVSWFIVLYFISSYASIYPIKIFTSIKFCTWAMIFSVILSMTSVVACTWLGEKIGSQGLSYYFVVDSNKILAVITSFFMFLFFKSIKIKHNRIINIVASSTFGVLLIHANSDTMRRWLWQDVLKNTSMYSSQWLVLHALISVLAIYIICTLIDLIRIKLLEKPFLKWWDQHFSKIYGKFKKIDDKICEKLHIENDDII